MGGVFVVGGVCGDWVGGVFVVGWWVGGVFAVGVVGWVVCLWWWWGGWFGVQVRGEVGGYWCWVDLCNPLWSLTLFPRGILIFQGVLTKLNFLTNFHIWKELSI